MQPNGGPQGRMGLPPAGGSVSTAGPNRLVLARSLTLALALAAGAVRAATPPLAVPLALEESAGVARHAWPASASVPLPRGRVRRPDALWLAGPPQGATRARVILLRPRRACATRMSL